MPTTLTSKGQVTIPKHIREELGLKPGMAVAFAVNKQGELVIHPAEVAHKPVPDRFEAVRGKADVKWRTQDLMKLLRGDD